MKFRNKGLINEFLINFNRSERREIHVEGIENQNQNLLLEFLYALRGLKSSINPVNQSYFPIHRLESTFIK